MSEPRARTVALVALVIAVLALAVAGIAYYRVGQYREELRRLGDLLVGSERSRGGLILEPIPRPPEPDPDPR